MLIGEAARQLNISVETLRYYDRIGLVSPPRHGRVRRYRAEDLNRIRTILQMKQLMFSLAEIRTILAIDRQVDQDLAAGRPAAGAILALREQVSAQLDKVEDLEKSLRAVKAELGALLAKIDRALGGGPGMNFDTAPLYHTEEILGEALARHRDQVTIATKVGAYPGAERLSREHITASCHASLRRLGTDCLDLYLVHYDDDATAVDEVLETLEKLQDQGKIRAYGLGHLPASRTAAYLEQGNPRLVMAEMHCAMPGQYQKLRSLQQKYSFGIIAFSVTGRGLLAGEASQPADAGLRSIDPLFRRNKLASGLRIAAKLQEMARDSGATPAQIAIAWVLAQPGVAGALTGPADRRHLEENCAALHLKLDPALEKELNALVYREAEAFRQQITREIASILASPARGPDLVYCLEHGVEMELFPRDEGARLLTEILRGHNLARCQRQLQSLLHSAKSPK